MKTNALQHRFSEGSETEDVQTLSTIGDRMYFFKYQRPGNLEFSNLRHASLYFASISELNDASECRPRLLLSGTRELWQRLTHFILVEVLIGAGYMDFVPTEITSQILALSNTVGTSLKTSAGKRDIGMEHLGRIFADVLENEIQNKMPSFDGGRLANVSRQFIELKLPKIVDDPQYIASFSLTATNPTMWGHYASAETGFVIVYCSDSAHIHVHSPVRMMHGIRPSADGIDEFGIYKDKKIQLQKVKYRLSPPKVNVFQRLIPKFHYSEADDHYDVPLQLPGDASRKQEDQVGLIKFRDWKYEQEIRAFLPSRTSLTDTRLLRVPATTIKGLIFGPKMSEHDMARSVVCCHLMREVYGRIDATEGSQLSEMVFFKAEQQVDRFEFDIRPIGVLSGSYYGDFLPLKRIANLDEECVQRLRVLRQMILKPDAIG